ncbi:flavin reductase family protein [Stackebrandtia soli]|uniref:flavin reductase family protein n=1 Tax=Stackebrandtia soli TaxID=1892856 RepID=UPI0039EC4811
MTLLRPSAAEQRVGGASRTARLRRTLGAFTTGVTVVTTTAEDGTPVGLTVNSFTSVSLEPPLILWCLGRRSSLLGAFETATHFAVNVLSLGQSATARRFATSGVDRFEDVEWQLGPGGVPLVDGAAAWLVCRRTPVRVPAGDHVVFFGEVLSHRATGAEPLVFARGQYRALDPDRLDP